MNRNIDETKNRIASRFQVGYEGELISSHADYWTASEAGVAYMRKHRVSPVTVWDSMSKLAPEFQTATIHISAYEGTPEEKAAKALLFG